MLPHWPSVVIDGPSMRTAPLTGESITRTDVNKLIPAAVKTLGHDAYGAVTGKLESVAVIAELHDGREVTVIDGLASQQIAEELSRVVAEHWDLRKDALQPFARLDRTS